MNGTLHERKSLMIRLLPGILLAVLTGCIRLHSDIVVVHRLPGPTTHIRYASMPFPERQGSLEYRSYERLIKNELSKHGFIESTIHDADLLLFFIYGSDTGKEVVYSNYGRSYVPGSDVEIRYRTKFTRFLTMELLDRSSFAQGRIQKVYEANVFSTPNSQVAKVMPTMIKALFEEFPGQSGSTRRVVLPVE